MFAPTLTLTRTETRNDGGRRPPSNGTTVRLHSTRMPTNKRDAEVAQLLWSMNLQPADEPADDPCPTCGIVGCSMWGQP